MHLFEVYANQECTERPQVGQSYDTLYVKVNADLSWGHDYDYYNIAGSHFEGLACYLKEVSGDDPGLTVYVDFSAADFDTPPVANQVFVCSSREQHTITEPLQVSFGPIAPFVHQVEIFADEECTERPVTGQSYHSLYASLHGVAEDEEMNEGQNPNSFKIVPQGNTIVLTYAEYWAKTINRDSEYILNQVHQLEVNYPSDELTANVFSFGKIVTDE